MKPSALLCFLAAVAAVLAADAAGTNTVEKFAYRGTLANADGSAFASVLPMQMTFRLYDRETGGTPLWGRTRPVRVETNGTFYIELDDARGSPSDDNLPYDKIAQALASTNGTFWIGLSPGEYSEMAPRQRLASVPCALHAVTADKITDLRAGHLTAPTIRVESATIENLVVTNSFHASGNVTYDSQLDYGILRAKGSIQLNGTIYGIRQWTTNSSVFHAVTWTRPDTFIVRGNDWDSTIQGEGWASRFILAGERIDSCGLETGNNSITLYSFGPVAR